MCTEGPGPRRQPLPLTAVCLFLCPHLRAGPFLPLPTIREPQDPEPGLSLNRFQGTHGEQWRVASQSDLASAQALPGSRAKGSHPSHFLASAPWLVLAYSFLSLLFLAHSIRGVKRPRREVRERSILFNSSDTYRGPTACEALSRLREVDKSD